MHVPPNFKKKNWNKRVFCPLKLVEEFDDLIFLLLKRYCLIPNGTLRLIAKKIMSISIIMHEQYYLLF